jgi:hypothetical protein
MMLGRDHVDNQYAWLQELVQPREAPKLEPTCKGGDQLLYGADKQFRIYVTASRGTLYSVLIETASWNRSVKTAHSAKVSTRARYSEMALPGSFCGRKKGTRKDCLFDCKKIFTAFVDSDKCFTGDKMQKNGEIVTDCGTASYLGYKLEQTG